MSRKLNLNLAILSVTGYYWHEGEISHEMGIGLTVGATGLSLLFFLLVGFGKVNINKKAQNVTRIEMSDRSSRRNTNPYMIN